MPNFVAEIVFPFLFVQSHKDIPQCTYEKWRLCRCMDFEMIPPFQKKHFPTPLSVLSLVSCSGYPF